MAGLLYFRPGLVKPTPDDIRELGLEHAFTRHPASRDCIGKGPSGVPGVVFADPERMGNASIGYYDKDQEWRPIPVAEGEPKVWIGWYRDQKPTPADLARVNQLDGHRVALGDGNAWLVPAVQEWTGDDGRTTKLPRPVTRRGDGVWVYGEVVPKYQAIWTAATKYWETIIATMSGAEDPEATRFLGICDFACELMALNYVVSWMEISALELFIPETAERIADAAVDWPTFKSWFQKKTEEASAGDDSSPG